MKTTSTFQMSILTDQPPKIGMLVQNKYCKQLIGLVIKVKEMGEHSVIKGFMIDYVCITNPADTNWYVGDTFLSCDYEQWKPFIGEVTLKYQ